MKKRILSLTLAIALVLGIMVFTSCNLLKEILTLDAFVVKLVNNDYEVKIADEASVTAEEKTLKNYFSTELDIVGFIAGTKGSTKVYVYELNNNEDATTLADVFDGIYKCEVNGKFVIASNTEQGLADARVEL